MGPGLPFFDYGALQLTPAGEHGAITHMIQDVTLINAGIDVVQFRKDLATVQRAFRDWVDVEGRKVGLGIGLWNVTDDVDPGTYGSPEHMWQDAMKQTLGIKDREL